MASTLTREQHLELYYFLRLNRELEEQMVRLFRQNKIVGGLYPSLGQEAISVGTAYALAPGDWIAPMIRNIGALLVRGFKPRDVMTQHMARYTSPTQGKDGTSHFGDLKSRHVISPTSMLGDLIPVMTGIAMAGRYLGQKIVTMTWIGDGGTSTGVFHEGLNLAAVQKAPFILIVENNQWAYSTPVEKQSALRDLADRAKAYGIKSAVVDGNDIVAVERTTREAASYDAAEYVPRALLETWKQRDPLRRFEKLLTEKKLWNANTKKEIDERIRSEIRADVEFAENSPLPPPESAEEGVYCEGCHTIEADWQRPKEQVMPPRSSVKAEWQLKSYAANGARPRATEHAEPKTKPGKKPERAAVRIRAKAGR
jgi:pyruvate dehydrogenase E1 component alpha subunit/2-oxoisovalerate dehydrogenase E1 component alpha subunit